MSHVDIAIANLSPEMAKTQDELQRFSAIICIGAMLYVDNHGTPRSVGAPQSGNGEPLTLLEAAKKHAPDAILLRASSFTPRPIQDVQAAGLGHLPQGTWEITFEVEIDDEKLAMDKGSVEKFLDAWKRVKYNGAPAAPGNV